MDVAFHGPAGSAYKMGTAEHKELAEFIPKLARILEIKDRGMSASGHAVTNEISLAQAPESQPPHPSNPLGLPGSYCLRYRVNVAVVADPAQVTAAASSRGHKQTGEGSTIQEAAGAGGLAPATERYRAMLAHYEDFRQKKTYSRLLKLRADQAALPMAPYEQHFISLLRDSQVVVLAGDTGCGKSTQLPQFLLRAGFSKVAVTQPRRISAIALCRRVAYETLNEHGDEVAYQVRFDSSRGRSTKVTFMTEGILLRRLVGDPMLLDFDCVVLDEVHERHLSTDFLLALLRAIVMQRPSLRVVLMSATINVDAYSAYFGGAPVVCVPGRLHPVKVVYLPPKEERGAAGGRESARRSREDAAALATKGGKRIFERLSAAPYLSVIHRIDAEVPQDERGDVLVFLSGMDDISILADALSEYASRTGRWVVLKLHSSMAVEEQDRVFDVAEAGVRKCILSTNIAETSVTIDGIR